MDSIRELVRSVLMRPIVKALNKMSNGKISPATVTLISLAAHVPIAYFIAQQRYILAAILLVIFGLFDALDGELARLQKKASPSGMLLDASTDRMKEVLIYAGATYSFIGLDQPYMSVWAVLALGGSLLVSYVKAKGETAIATAGKSSAEVNRAFSDGLLTFELRIAVILLGLFSGWLALAVIIIAILAWFTAFQRLILISRSLRA